MGILRGSQTRSGRKSLADALFSTTQQRVLAILFGEPERSFYATELIKRAGSGSGAVQRELEKLERSGIISTQRIGNQKHFQANQKSPVFSDLRGLVEKTVGLAEPIRTALRPIFSDVVAAFVYGSVAKRMDTARSDIDLMVITDTLTYGDVFGALEPLARKLERNINPTVYSRRELQKRLNQGNAFIKRILDQPKIWVIGSEHDLAA